MSCDERVAPGLLVATTSREQPRSDEGEPQPQSEDRVERTTRYLLVTFAVFTLLAVNQLLMLGRSTDRFFAWTIASRPNATFLGAAYAAGFVLSVLALRQRRWSRVRLPIVTVTAFTILTLVPTLWHEHRLHLMAEDAVARAAAQVWLVVYIVVPVACLLVLARQGSRPRRTADPGVRMKGWLVVLLLGQGAALAVAGVVLWLGGAESHAMVEVARAPWPWPVTPLTSQVLGAWLLSFAIGIGASVHDRDLGSMLVPAVAYAAFGAFALVVLLAFRAAPGTDAGWLVADAALLVTVVPTGVYGWWRARGTPAGVVPAGRPQSYRR